MFVERGVEAELVQQKRILVLGKRALGERDEVVVVGGSGESTEELLKRLLHDPDQVTGLVLGHHRPGDWLMEAFHQGQQVVTVDGLQLVESTVHLHHPVQQLGVPGL